MPVEFPPQKKNLRVLTICQQLFFHRSHRFYFFLAKNSNLQNKNKNGKKTERLSPQNNFRIVACVVVLPYVSGVYVCLAFGFIPKQKEEGKRIGPKNKQGNHKKMVCAGCVDVSLSLSLQFQKKEEDED